MRALLRSLKKRLGHRNVLRLGWHKSKVLAAAIRYGFPARALTVIGITGTDGKTTAVSMTAHILQQSGIQTGSLSTAFFQVKNEQTWNETQKTAPSPFIVQSMLRRFVASGCTHAVLEYSSHGLVQGRAHWTWPLVAAITNTSPEHLDYHGTMEQYRRDKGMLFGMLRKNGAKVLNILDGTYPLYRTFPSARTILFAGRKPDQMPQLRKDDAFLWISGVDAMPLSSSATVHCIVGGQEAETTHRLELAIPGTFNLDNALCAIGCALGAGVELHQAVEALRSFRGVPGRIEPIPGPQRFSVYVDFTVTPASYERTLAAVRATLKGKARLLVLTGSCGDRYREKRPEVGRICSELANTVVVTNEDPYTEDPEKIIDEVWSGIDSSKTDAHRIRDRREAIRFIFSKAQEGDAVLLCGKGSDTTMMLPEGQVPWNEREIAKEMLQEMFSS